MLTRSDPETPHPYKLKFVPKALDEWRSLDGSIKEVLRRALKKHLLQPHVPGSRLRSDLVGCYKIKLRKQGYRLVYAVEDDALIVLVLAIDKREDSLAYRAAAVRLAQH